jgi:alkanesulfonate monooxygenase SsuD/methylene tetrahydromethanopterin reductase-like flavin-dependent oxidoreductase (luciferase family)
VELCIFVEPQLGATYEQQLKVARKTEEFGFTGFFRSDHLLGMGGADPGPGPTESWVALAALARETSRIRLGTLMTSATFRHPAVLAVSVAQTLACARDEDAARARAKRIGRDLDEMRTKDAGGTPPEVVRRLKGWAGKGVSRVYLQLLDIHDIDQVELVGSEVLPALAGLASDA